jgi:hypothetical protein
MTKHFEDLLIMNGFVLSVTGTPKKIDKNKQEEIKAITEQIREDFFNEFLETEYKGLEKYDTFNKHIKFLNIPTTYKEVDEETGNIITEIDLYTTYKNEIMDKHMLQDHLNVIRLLKTDEYINEKIITAKHNSYDVKNMTMIYSKVKAIRDLETKYKIEPLNINYEMKGEIDMSEREYKYIKNAFRITRAKPKTYEDLRKVYATMLRHVTNGDLIKAKQCRVDGKKQMVYDIDHEYIQGHLELNKFSNPNCTKFHEHFVAKYKIPVKEIKFDDNDEYEDVDTTALDIII